MVASDASMAASGDRASPQKASFHLRLLDLLRRRKELLPGEVCHLLDSLPAKLDAEANIPSALINRAVVRFTANATDAFLADALSMNVTDWPDFELILLPGNPGETSQLNPSERIAADRGGIVMGFGMLLYELLGGTRRDAAGMARFSPLSHLGEQANEVLRHALSGKEQGGCSAFWQQWKHEVARDVCLGIAEWRIPVWLLEKHQTGAVLELTPFRSSHLPIRLTSEPAFCIGRSQHEADYALRYSSGSGRNTPNVKELSRKHVLVESGPLGTSLRDGDGVRPSTNGSSFDGLPLAADTARLFKRRGLLSLSDQCRIEVVPALRAKPRPFAIANFQDWSGAVAENREASTLPPMSGAVYFVPQQGVMPLRDAVWLFSEIGFTLSPKGRVVWTELEDAATGWFVYRAGSFWLANAALEDGAVQIDDSPLATGQIAPLVSGSCLRLGKHEFSITVA